MGLPTEASLSIFGAFPRQRYGLFSLPVAIGLLLLAEACSSTEHSPVAPSNDVPQVTASLEPVPVPVRSQITGVQGPNYQINVDVTFRETAGVAGRITRINVAVVDRSGDSGRRSVDVALEVGARGTAKQTLAETVGLTRGHEPARLQLSADGVGQTGRTFTVQAVEVPVTMDGAPSFSDAVFVGAGDIADCGAMSAATGRLLDRIPGGVFTLGDNAYPSGTPEQFANCYEPTWGRHKWRTFPSPGNHDWEISAGMPYFAYFGFAAGIPGLGYYSFDLGAWHILSLNSNVPAGPGSPQHEWVRRDLAAHPSTCTLAYWHHPLFSSGEHGNDPVMRDMWRLLDAEGADVVLVGHDHDYERFAPQDADGRPDPRGMRQFVVGTGGGPLYALTTIKANSEVREIRTWGVLRLTLQSNGYDWEFVPVEGQSFRDFGSAACTP